MDAARIVRSVPATDSEWDHTWNTCSYSTYFHSREWSDVWCRAQHAAWSPEAQHIEFADGRTALLVGVSRRRRMGGRAFATGPEGTYGGWLSLDSLSSEHGRAMVRHLCAEFSLVRWRANPWDPSLVDVHLPDADDDVSQVLDLAKGYQALAAGWSKSLRYDVRKARREGVTVRAAESSEDWRGYYEVYLDTRSRWGSGAVGPLHDYSLFDNFHRLQSSHVELLIAEHDGVIVAGGLFLSSPSHTAYWHAATARAALDLSPMNAVLATAIERASDVSSRAWFDFLPSAHLAGVEFYKRRFRAAPLPAPYLTTARSRFRSSNLVRAGR